MKILFLSQTVPYPPHGGLLQRGYNLLREITREASVHLLAFVHPDVLPTEAACRESQQAMEKLCPRVELFPLWSKASQLHYAAALATSACSTLPFGVIGYRSAAYQRRVTSLIASESFDVVHADTIELSQFLGPQQTVPSVLTHQNVESVLMRRRAQVETRPPARWFLQRETEKLIRYEQLATRWYDVNILVSQLDAQALTEHVPGLRTAVVDNGVDVEYFTPSTEPEEAAMIYAGSMTMFANRDAVMYFVKEVWPKICAEKPSIQFYAVGKSPPQELLALAARDSRIVVAGYVDDIRPFVRKSAVYVVPLRVGGGTRLKVLDAMAMGKAIVSTTIGCEGLDVRPGEHLVVADSPDTFAHEVLTLLSNQQARLALGRAARGLVERRYSWKIIGSQLLETYRDAIQSKQSRQ